VVDVSNPANCVLVGGFDTGQWAYGVHVAGSLAYLAGDMGLQVIDVSSPTNCVRVGAFNTGSYAYFFNNVHVANHRIYIAAGTAGLLVLHSVPGVQFTVEVNGTPDADFTIEGASTLTPPIQWTPLLTTNSSTMPFYFTDLDVQGPQKFYRVREEMP